MAYLHQQVLSSHTPPSWARMRGEVHEVDLPKSSSEFETVAAKVRRTLSVTIDHVKRIQNPFLWGSYILKKQEYIAQGIPVNEMDLFHCTAASNISSIINDNLDWRRSSRTKFGRGVSFSPSASYANKYANYRIGSSRALILMKVVCGRTCQGRESMVIPSEGFNTSLGNGTNVYVKYYDYEFYPSYVVFYNNNDDHHDHDHHYDYEFELHDFLSSRYDDDDYEFELNDFLSSRYDDDDDYEFELHDFLSSRYDDCDYEIDDYFS